MMPGSTTKIQLTICVVFSFFFSGPRGRCTVPEPAGDACQRLVRAHAAHPAVAHLQHAVCGLREVGGRAEPSPHAAVVLPVAPEGIRYGFRPETVHLDDDDECGDRLHAVAHHRRSGRGQAGQSLRVSAFLFAKLHS